MSGQKTYPPGIGAHAIHTPTHSNTLQHTPSNTSLYIFTFRMRRFRGRRIDDSGSSAEKPRWIAHTPTASIVENLLWGYSSKSSKPLHTHKNELETRLAFSVRFDHHHIRIPQHPVSAPPRFFPEFWFFPRISPKKAFTNLYRPFSSHPPSRCWRMLGPGPGALATPCPGRPAQTRSTPSAKNNPGITARAAFARSRHASPTKRARARAW